MQAFQKCDAELRSESSEMLEQQGQTVPWRKSVVVLVGFALLFAAVAMVNNTPPRGLHGVTEGRLISFEETPCSDAGQNCMESRCCKEAGHTCYQKSRHWAHCAAHCDPDYQDEYDKANNRSDGWQCLVLEDLTQLELEGNEEGKVESVEGESLEEDEQPASSYDWTSTHKACGVQLKDAEQITNSIKTEEACKSWCQMSGDKCSGYDFKGAPDEGKCILFARLMRASQATASYKCVARVWVGKWEDAVENKACRLDKSDTSYDGQSTVVHVKHETLHGCQSFCRSMLGSNCHGVEYHTENKGCELYNRPITHMTPAKGFRCSVFKGKHQVKLKGTNFLIRSESSAKCIDEDFAMVECNYASSISHQRWSLTDSGYLINMRNGNGCLVDGGGALSYRPCSHKATWKFTGAGKLMTGAGTCIDVGTGEIGHAAAVKTCAVAAGQIFSLVHFAKPAELLRVDLPASLDAKAVCNDGSRPAYYFRKSTTPEMARTWLLYLKGGAWCTTKSACDKRPTGLKSSKTWGSKEMKVGIFGSKSTLGASNIAYYPYCSSDGHMGDGSAFGLEFRGYRIVRAIAKHLASAQGLKSGDTLVLAGFSAGGRGAMVHLDTIHEVLPSGVKIFGFLDSPIWLSTVKWQVEQMQQATNTWVSHDLLRACGDRFSSAERWKCICGEFRVPILKTPFLVVASQYDRFGLKKKQ